MPQIPDSGNTQVTIRAGFATFLKPMFQRETGDCKKKVFTNLVYNSDLFHLNPTSRGTLIWEISFVKLRFQVGWTGSHCIFFSSWMSSWTTWERPMSPQRHSSLSRPHEDPRRRNLGLERRKLQLRLQVSDLYRYRVTFLVEISVKIRDTKIGCSCVPSGVTTYVLRMKKYLLGLNHRHFFFLSFCWNLKILYCLTWFALNLHWITGITKKWDRHNYIVYVRYL